MDVIVQPVLKQATSLAAGSGLQPEDVRSVLDLYTQFFAHFNLLVLLRTFPIGSSSLMSGRLPTQTPLGAPALLQVDSPGQLVGLILLLTLAGWMLGALYFRSVAALVIPESLADAAPTAGRALIQTLVYSLLCAVLIWTLGLPVVFLVYLLFAVNSWLGQAVLLLFGFASLWLIVPLFFSPHGMFVRKQNAVASFLGSFQMTRFTLPNTSLFVLTVLLIAMGLNVLWSVPTDDSWLALVGILGHAFITTALLASSFIYYQQMTSWLQTVLARLRASMPTQQA
jgi:hypothetical protein